MRRWLASIFLLCLLLPAPVAAQEIWYRVRAGDSIESIATAFAVSAALIRQHNGLAAQSPLVAGQILRIPQPEAPPPTAAPQSDSGRSHIVQAGETLQIIGQFYGLDWLTLARFNNISNANLIQAGQVLALPDSAGAAPPPAAPSPTPVPAPVSAPPAGQRIHIAQPGDSLNRIAQNFGLALNALLRLNNFHSGSALYVGDVILLPAAAAAPVSAANTASDLETARQHVVQFGDTVADIAARYGSTVAEIAAANGLLNINRIDVGQTLIIPLGGFRG